jgi:hypothetical protein
MVVPQRKCLRRKWMSMLDGMSMLNTCTSGMRKKIGIFLDTRTPNYLMLIPGDYCLNEKSRV